MILDERFQIYDLTTTNMVLPAENAHFAQILVRQRPLCLSATKGSGLLGSYRRPVCKPTKCERSEKGVQRPVCKATEGSGLYTIFAKCHPPPKPTSVH